MMSNLSLDGVPEERPRPQAPTVAGMWRRCLETLVVVFVALLFIGGCVIGPMVLVTLVYYKWYKIVLAYLVFYVLDWKTSSNGGRRWNWLRSSMIWKMYCTYFPVRMIKTADLPPERNYLFGYHPHGIISCGAFACFATEGNGFSDLYPGITPSLMTLGLNFIWPLTRLFFMALGMVDVSKQSILSVLGGRPCGNAAVIVIGGAAESMLANPAESNLVLKNRKGFIKLSIRCGVNLVPVYAFQENDLFYQASHPLLKKIQGFVKQLTGVAPPLAFGAWNLPLPLRSSVNVVVGKPIYVQQCDEPSQQHIDRVHGQYITQLQQLYNKYKGQFSQHPSTPIQFV